MRNLGDEEFDNSIDPEESVNIEFSGTIYEGFIDTGREHIPFVAKCDGEEIAIEIDPLFEAKYGMGYVAEMCEEIEAYLEENYH